MGGLCHRLAVRASVYALIAALPFLLAVQRARAGPMAHFADVVAVPGNGLSAFNDVPIERLALLACSGELQHPDKNACRPIPFQVDERDAQGHWALEHGPHPNSDDPPGVLDGNDLLLFMAADAGIRVRRQDLPAPSPIAQIILHDPETGWLRWAYLVSFADKAPRSPVSYVQYNPLTDRVQGARVRLGFNHGVPNYLALTNGNGSAGTNLLDRFKVRASATFLWGLIHFSRTEDDLRTQFVGWHQGPIRIIRRQLQWVHIGWGIRSPTFGSYTFFYRDFAELPVGLRLNFPPTYFFGNIVVRAVLDFRDLRGWSLILPNAPSPIDIDGVMTHEKQGLNNLPASWFALRGPIITLVQAMNVSPSLATLRRRLYYHETESPSEPPEGVAGEQPGIGYQLDEWTHVRAGAHSLESISYALPTDVNVRDFMRARNVPLQVSVVPLPR